MVGSITILFAARSEVFAQGALDLWKQAQQFQEEGNREQALTLYTEGLSREPQHPHAHKAYNNRGLLYYASGDCEKALADFDSAIELNSGDSECYYNRGNAYRCLAMVDRAIGDYTRSIQFNPGNGAAYNNRGSL